MPRYAMVVVVEAPDEETAWEAVPATMDDGVETIYLSNGWRVEEAEDGYGTEQVEMYVDDTRVELTSQNVALEF